MHEYAANTFASFMIEYPAFRPVAAAPVTSGGSLVLGHDVQTWQAGTTIVTFDSSAGHMALKIVKAGHPVVDRSFDDFRDVTDEVRRVLGTP